VAPTVAQLRAQSIELRALGWSYRRIAAHWRQAHGLGSRLAFRVAHGWTQEEAARRWNDRWPATPKTGKSFSYWETWPAPGGRAPSPLTLARLAELYLCRPGDLLDGVDYGVLDPGRDARDGEGNPCGRGGHDGCQAGDSCVAGGTCLPGDSHVPDGGACWAGACSPDPDFELELGLAFGQQFWYITDALCG